MKKNLTEDLLNRSRLHAIQYQHIDGTFELTFGGAFLLMAACFYIISNITITNPFLSNNLLPFAPLVVFVGGIYLIDNLVQQLRNRFTYPRTGYITHQKPRPLQQSTRLVIWIGLPVLTMILLALIFFNRGKINPANQNFMSILLPSFFGLLFIGLWMIVGWKTSIPRFYLIAVVSLLASAAIFLNGVGGNSGMALLFGAMGAVLCLSGGLTLLQYLHKNPAPLETTDEQ